MPTPTDTLMADARCINQCIPSGMQLAVLISMLAKLLGMTTDTNAMMAAARCINSCIPAGMQMAVLIGLVDQFLSGGGAGAGTTGHGPPTTSPSAALTWYVDLDTDTVYLWYGGAWHP
jgi:hypothetical protein